MSTTITIMPRTAGEEILKQLISNNVEGVELEFTEERAETIWEVGDKIESYGDSGPWSPAKVTGVSDDYVSFSYGPRFKFSTSLSRYSGSIRTDRRKIYPATLRARLVGAAMEWVDLNPE